MLHRLNNPFSVRSDEQGAILILSIFVVVGLLALGALAVDAGNIYRTRINLQKAADAGAIAGVQARLEVGFPAGRATRLHAIQDRARTMTLANLRLHGISAAQVEPIVPQYLAAEEQVRVQIRYRLRLLLMHIVPFQIFNMGKIGPDMMLEVVGDAQPQPVNIALVLDTSNSMACPANQPDCSCLDSAGGCPGSAKIESLRTAVSNFLSRYNPARDRISLIAFNTRSRVSLGFKTTGLGFNAGLAEQQLNLLQPRGATNMCDGLYTAYKQLQSIDALRNTKRPSAVVVFSDGAPTGGRFCFSSRSGLRGPAQNCQNNRNEDMCYYSLKWVETSSAPNSSPVTIVGPSPLVPCKSILYGAGIGGMNLETILAAKEPCSQLDRTSATTASSVDPKFQGCIGNDLSFIVPGIDPRNISSVEQSARIDLANWQNALYDCPAAWADSIRARDVPVYMIGIGSPPLSAPENQYYQFDTSIRNDPFGIRVAGDKELARCAGTIGTDRLLNFRGRAENFTAATGDTCTVPDGKEGLYLASVTAESLTPMFVDISKNINSRLFEPPGGNNWNR